MALHRKLLCTAWLLCAACVASPPDGEDPAAQADEAIGSPQKGAADNQGAGGADSGKGQGEGEEKVTICHIPPGNPGNAHTITVGEPAVPAHLAHGDYLGPCKKHGEASSSSSSAASASSSSAASSSSSSGGGTNTQPSLPR